MQPVAVIGGGPAAGAAGLTLARGGAAVTVFHPPRGREKPCGGAVPAPLIGSLAGFDPSALPAVDAGRAVLENASGSRIEVSLAGIRVFSRRDLAGALLAAAAAAGARLVPAVVTAIAPSASGVVVRSRGDERRYRSLIAADGAHGVSRRCLGLPADGESVGVGASLASPAGGEPGWVVGKGGPGMRGPDATRGDSPSASSLVLAFPDAADAYLWIFPRPGGVSVGIVYRRGELSDGAAAGTLREFLARHLPHADRWPGPRYRYPIPVFNRRTLGDLARAASRGVLLAGDAAALADPLTREGIRYAILSGQWAAEAVLNGCPADHPDRVQHHLADEMERAARARRLFFEDPLGQWMVPVARAHPGVAAVLADLLACRQPYRGLRRRLLRAAAGL